MVLRHQINQDQSYPNTMESVYAKFVRVEKTNVHPNNCM